MSVSTLIMLRGAATPLRVVKFCMMPFRMRSALRVAGEWKGSPGRDFSSGRLVLLIPRTRRGNSPPAQDGAPILLSQQFVPLGHQDSHHERLGSERPRRAPPVGWSCGGPLP